MKKLKVHYLPIDAHVVIGHLNARGVLELVTGVANRYAVAVDDLCGRAQVRRVAHARHAVWSVLRRHEGLSLPAIGRMFGRDHSTVLSGCRAHDLRQRVAALGATEVL